MKVMNASLTFSSVTPVTRTTQLQPVCRVRYSAKGV
jgi:hypothetical protein